MSEHVRVGEVFGDAAELLRRHGARMLLVSFAVNLLPSLYEATRALTLEPTWVSLEHYENGELHQSVLAAFAMLGTIACTMVLAQPEGWGTRLSRVLPGFGVQLLTSVVIVVGFVFLVIPGLVAFAAFAVSLPIVIDEGRSVTDAMRLSTERTSNNRLAIGWALLVPGLFFGLGPYGFGYWLFSRELLSPQSWVDAYRLVTIIDIIIGPLHTVVAASIAWAIHRRLAPLHESVDSLVDVFS